ncbi:MULTISPECIES: heparan-alpha-glucosaminide N-acetyltransferase domain-containing protein [Acidobacterium]|uniref:Putative membrane protein n=1 Tax=Acidobacterium capsulatum (strain ATCC 51196 / DSM 11244 / BCRC 80197 / JCM 7670 / NBRC 15755 / NCIMB 13165 / 161) TaxID=240015 RepID=C1F727_ACIC5|nr:MULTISPECIES: heparan-alpha-glucosaminide N-acetyltransferase domain-containing protein [Acidobacterium]ACO32818.1 putative membrane protein [Acidobacterium capsulatum ATCC 51196]HCT59390.1 DUF1624 domain-containing protein [Acidobacterium sp.]
MKQHQDTVVNAKRMVSIDLLRGITIAFMILVNNNGDEAHAFWALKHAQWNGFTPTDLVFPTFIFVVGISLVFSTEARLRRGQSRLLIAAHALRRSVILFLLGLVVNGFPYFHFGTLRIYGVLQRIAICYLFGSLLYLLSRRVWLQALLFTTALVGYWALMRWVPVPGYGLPGRDIPFLDPNANLVAWLDRLLLPGRLYAGTRDPEGLLSTIPAMGTLLLGMMTAGWLRSAAAPRRKLMLLLAAAGIALTAGALWGLEFPINKRVWTSSYVLYAGGWSLLAFALCFWMTEVRKHRNGLYLWLAFGMNPITAYMFAELLQSTLSAIYLNHHLTMQRWLYLRILVVLPWPAWASLLYSVAFVFVCLIPIALMYRKRIFLRI